MSREISGRFQKGNSVGLRWVAIVSLDLSLYTVGQCLRCYLGSLFVFIKLTGVYLFIPECFQDHSWCTSFKEVSSKQQVGILFARVLRGKGIHFFSVSKNSQYPRINTFYLLYFVCKYLHTCSRDGHKIETKPNCYCQGFCYHIEFTVEERNFRSVFLGWGEERKASLAF